MKSSTIRLIVVLALLTSAGIILTQNYWVRKAWLLEEREFDLKAVTALRDVAVKVMEMKETQVPKLSPVTQIEPDYYIVETNVFVEKNALKIFLAEAFTNENLETDFEYGLYDCMSDTVQYQGYYQMRTRQEQNMKTLVYPRKKENYYFFVYFPHRSHYLTSQLSIWIVSSLVLILVVGFLGYLLFVIFKQKRLSEIQKDFIDNMTHEFKTPLSSIHLAAEVLKNSAASNNPQKMINYATIIDNEVVKLISQVEFTLQMARAEKSKLYLHKEHFVWQDLLQEVIRRFQYMMEEKKGEIFLNAPDETVEGFGDVLHLKNTISNLLDNAIKYCETNPRVSIVLRQEKNTVTITVTDNGIGIDSQYQKFLFDKFFRVPTGNVANVKGFGIGLNYVKVIVKAHDGEVKCFSEKGKGAAFILSFPTLSKQ